MDKKPLAFISQPMSGLTDEEILSKRKEVILYLKSLGYKVIDSFLTDIDRQEIKEAIEKNKICKNESILYLAYSILEMSYCDLAYFCDG